MNSSDLGRKTRAHKIFKMAKNNIQSGFNNTTISDDSDKNNHQTSSIQSTDNPSNGNDRASPLPANANLEELHELDRMLYNDLKDDSERTDIVFTNNQVEENEIYQIPSYSIYSRTDDISTPHPSSPECSTNHLDEDCTNVYCPYFIGQDHCQQFLTIQSPFSIMTATPQTHTPTSVMSGNITSTPTGRKNPRKDKGSVRRRHVSEWLDTKRKTLRNLGQEYITRKGVVKSKKKMGLPCKCRNKCYNKISNENRMKVFVKFWELGDQCKQWMYIRSLASKNNKRRVYVDTTSRRKFTFVYTLPCVGENGDLEFIKVCKKQFMSTFSVSSQFIETAFDKSDSMTGIVCTDLRGKHGKHPRKITEVVIKSVCDHIKCLQPVEAHYVRKDSSMLYLDGDLDYSKLFNLYIEWFDSNNYSDKAETKRIYKCIVKENFKLSFYKPKKDQCDECHIYKNTINPTEEQRIKHEKHVSNKNLARQLKTSDKTDSQKSNGKIVVATFDFQKILNAPYGQISILYYKRKLSTMNFTVFQLAMKEATCYMWHEGEGRRGSNEVSSCLQNFIIKCLEQGAKDIRFWSDNCTGQNRNRVVFAFYMYMSRKYKIDIRHTFLEKGHTQQEGDSVHALIEKSAKNKMIYTPAEWFSLVRWAKVNESPYNVVTLNHTDFFDFKTLLDGRNWTKNLNGECVRWSKIKQLQVFANSPNELHYKYDLSDPEFMTIVTKTNTRRQRQQHEHDDVPNLYNNPIPITKVKKDDLTYLCNSGVIPQIYHDFFMTLPFSDTNTTALDD